jgi:hypothetical protein
MNWKEFERKRSWPNRDIIQRIFREGLRKTTERFSHGIQYPSGDSVGNRFDSQSRHQMSSLIFFLWFSTIQPTSVDKASSNIPRNRDITMRVEVLSAANINIWSSGMWRSVVYVIDTNVSKECGTAFFKEKYIGLHGVTCQETKMLNMLKFFA